MDPAPFPAVSPEFTDRLADFIGQVRQKPYRFLHQQGSTGKVNQLVLEDILFLAGSHPEGTAIIQQAGEVAGLVACVDLPWDSRVFRSRWGAIKYVLTAPWASEKPQLLGGLVSRALAWAAARQVECLVVKTYADDAAAVHALERAGFLYMDTNLDYAVDLRNPPFETVCQPPLPAGVNLRLAEGRDAAGLLAVAGEAFRTHFSRYMVDEMIPKNLAENVYVEWMRSCLDGYADTIYLAEIKGRIAGYSIWKKPSSAEQKHGIRLGHYSIAGVHPDFAGLGLFSCLSYIGMKAMAENVDLIEGPTHINNYPVQRGYKKLGWQIYDARHAFHKWLAG